MRIHLFEFEDLLWFPNTIRQGETDYLRYLLNGTEFYKPCIPIISRTLGKIEEHKIIDLCSGGGGAIEQIHKGLQESCPEKIRITLSDKFPNINAYQHIKAKSNGEIDFEVLPVDATNVSPDIKGLRTIFSAVHHFSPEVIKAILKNSVNSNSGIAIFDGGDKNILTIIGILIFHPIAFLLCTPFFKPFKLSRLFFTYLIPLIPLTTIWDGCISILRLYDHEELLTFAKEVDNVKYAWESGKIKNKFGMHVTYLVGHPKSKI